MDIRVFPQLSNCNVLTEVTAALAVNLWVGSSIVSLPPLTLALAVSAVALIVLRPDGGRLEAAARSLARFSIVHVLCLATITPLVHESGHALMAILLFKNPGVSIQYHGLFAGASTRYAVSYGLTALGNVFGKEDSISLVAAGGMAASTVWSAFIFRYSRYLAVSQIYHETSYAFGALRSSWNWTNDYTQLWMQQGLHPLVPIVSMVATIALRL